MYLIDFLHLLNHCRVSLGGHLILSIDRSVASGPLLQLTLSHTLLLCSALHAQECQH